MHTHPNKGKVMSLVDELLSSAYEDTQLLLKNDQLGDIMSVEREVNFLLRTPDEKLANTVSSFINDNQYGYATVAPSDSDFGISVKIVMPSTQNVLCSVSALMCCLAALFSVEYDGWGSAVQRGA
jgi:Regulator of ribonuclease activity B